MFKGSARDVFIADINNLRTGAIWDPLKSLVDCAIGDMVGTVIIDGRPVVRDGEILGIDEKELLRLTGSSAQDRFDPVPETHWKRVTAQEAFPYFLRKAGPEYFPKK